MSRFIRARPKIGKDGARFSGFTEAELAAAEWARALPEVRENYERATNAELRGGAVVGGATAPAAAVAPVKELAVVEPAKKADEKEAKRMKKLEKKAKKEKSAKHANDDDAHKENSEARKLEKRMKKAERKLEKKLKRAERREKPPEPQPNLDAIDALIERARVDATGEVLSSPSRSSSSPLKEIVEPPKPVPRDPRNPLLEAQDLKAYQEFLRELEQLAKARGRRSRGQDDPRWNHEGYLNRSPSPCRLRTDGAWAATRKGAWRSRAGGVYMPPTGREHPDQAGGDPPPNRRFRSPSKSPSPAKYLYPEEFQQRRMLQEQRRSPSYSPMRRHSRSRSASRSQSRGRQRRRARGDSVASGASRAKSTDKGGNAKKDRKTDQAQRRPSPVYRLDKPVQSDEGTANGGLRVGSCEN